MDFLIFYSMDFSWSNQSPIDGHSYCFHFPLSKQYCSEHLGTTYTISVLCVYFLPHFPRMFYPCYSRRSLRCSVIPTIRSHRLFSAVFSHRTPLGFRGFLFCFVFFSGNSFIEVQFTYHTIHPFKVYNSVVFSIFTKLYSHYITTINFRTFSSPQKETLYPLSPTNSPNQC